MWFKFEKDQKLGSYSNFEFQNMNSVIINYDHTIKDQYFDNSNSQVGVKDPSFNFFPGKG